MRFSLLFLVFSFSVIFGAEFSLKERLCLAKSGDYIVVEANKMITVLAIRSIGPETLLLEEISAPVQNLKNRPASWPQWVKAKAPGHTSWSMIEIDLATAKPIECFSFSRASWICLAENTSFFATLLQLPLKPLSKDRLKKIGPPPMPGEPDVRKVWAPSLVFEGKKLNNPRMRVFATTWPKDASELSERAVTLYFDLEKKLPFPFWIQAETSHLTAALRTIDAGANLPAFYKSMPRRVPEFVGLPLKTAEGLKLNLKSPKYYKEFELFAIDVTSKSKQIHPIQHSLIQGADEWLTVQIDQEELSQILIPNHRYTWMIVPMGSSESYTQTARPFTWLN